MADTTRDKEMKIPTQGDNYTKVNEERGETEDTNEN